MKDHYIIFFETVLDWLNTNILSFNAFIEVLTIAISITVLWIFHKFIETHFDTLINSLNHKHFIEITTHIKKNYSSVLLIIILFIEQYIFELYGRSNYLLLLAANLLLAWVVIKFLSHFIVTPGLSKIVSIFIWIIVALNLTGFLDDINNIFDKLSFSVGDFKVSFYEIIKGVIFIGILFKISKYLSKFFEKKINSNKEITPSFKVLLSKVVKIVLYSFAVIFGLDMVGVDLAGFAFFSGAIGVGIGFGLQKIVSNLISGFILLLDRSIKPGDIIEVGEYYGSIISLSSRYVSVRMLDGKEYLIPNEQLITNQVINWSHTDNLIRIDIDISISYDADPNHIINSLKKAVSTNSYILKNPKPNVLLKNFGDSAVNFVVMCWVDTPEKPTIPYIKSELNLLIWYKLKEENIKIPYPQLDIHYDK